MRAAKARDEETETNRDTDRQEEREREMGGGRERERERETEADKQTTKRDGKRETEIRVGPEARACESSLIRPDLTNTIPGIARLYINMSRTVSVFLSPWD